MKYYNLKKILSKNAHYNIIFGERSNGKTYALLEYGLKNYCNNGEQIAYLRRYKEDIIGKRASNIWNAIIDNKLVEKYTRGKYTTIHYFSGAFYLANYDEKLGKNVPNWNECIGYVFSLTDMEHNKSTSYPNITTIVFDEFLTRQYYLTDEFILFMNTLSTIIRERTNVKIFMLGNTVNKYCPYFKELGLKHIDHMKQGTIDVYSYGDSKLKVAVEYVSASNSLRKKSNLYFAFNNPKLEMIKSGTWEIDNYPHCPYKYSKSDILFIYFIEFDNALLQCEIVQKDNKIFTFIHEKTTPIKNIESDIIFSTNYSANANHFRNILKPTTTITKKIAMFYLTDNVFYQNNEVGEIIRNYLLECKKNSL